MSHSIAIIIGYPKKFRVTAWRAVKCLRPCDRLLSPLSVILEHLIIRVSETSHSCHYSLLAEVEIDSMESCKMSETL